MEVASPAQAAAIAGIGLLYEGSCHRLMTEFLLNELGKRPTNEPHEREAYSLCCGLALGMVNLSSGKKSNADGKNAGLSDLRVEERLHKYIVGGRIEGDHRQWYDSFDRTNGSGSNHVGDVEKNCRIYEGDMINLDVTSPGATLALGLMYIRSG